MVDKRKSTKERLLAWFRRSSSPELEFQRLGTRNGHLFVPTPEFFRLEIEESERDDWTRQLQIPPAPSAPAESVAEPSRQ